MSTKVIDTQPIAPPDNEEIELAKLVLGDTTDFQNNLSNFDMDMLDVDYDSIQNQNDNLESDEDENDNAQMNVNDDQLFFIDDGAEESSNAVDHMDVDSEEDNSASDNYDNSSDAAWDDSDDERLNIPITNTNTTKKLRTSYDQHVISGSSYINRLREQFEKIYPRPEWADAQSSDEENDSDIDNDENFEKVIDGDISALSKILQTTYSFKDTSSTKLLPVKTLDILRLKDANFSHPSKSAIQSLSFHPFKPLLLTGGYDKTLRIYHIDGKTNHLVTSVYLKGTPVQTCTFYVSQSNSKQNIPVEEKIFTGGRRRYMHSWDLSSNFNNDNSSAKMAKIDKISRLYGHEQSQRSFEKFKVGHFYNFTNNSVHGIILLQGNSGWINVIHATTGVWLMGCKIEGNLVDFCIDYKPLSKNKFITVLIATNTYGEIWEFDLSNNGKILRKWKDQGGVGITTIQVGGGTNSNNFFPISSGKVKENRWLAIGSESGYVNIYDRKSSSTSEPVATLDQLTTSISHLVFSPDGQMLCMASRAIKDALRLVHLPSFSVFSNWPTSGTPLGKVTSVTFSPRGEMLAVGNLQGKVRLWRLNHY